MSGEGLTRAVYGKQRVMDFPISPEAEEFIASAAILAEPYNEEIAALNARIAAAAELVRSSILLPCWCFDEALEYTGYCEKHRILTALGVNE